VKAPLKRDFCLAGGGSGDAKKLPGPYLARTRFRKRYLGRGRLAYIRLGANGGLTLYVQCGYSFYPSAR